MKQNFLQHCLGIKTGIKNLKTMNIFLDQNTNIILTCFIFQQRRINLFSLLPEDLKIILDDPTIATGWIYTKVEINFKD
jgi:hypothetical protein